MCPYWTPNWAIVSGGRVNPDWSRGNHPGCRQQGVRSQQAHCCTVDCQRGDQEGNPSVFFEPRQANYFSGRKKDKSGRRHHSDHHLLSKSTFNQPFPIPGGLPRAAAPRGNLGLAKPRQAEASSEADRDLPRVGRGVRALHSGRGKPRSAVPFPRRARKVNSIETIIKLRKYQTKAACPGRSRMAWQSHRLVSQP